MSVMEGKENIFDLNTINKTWLFVDIDFGIFSHIVLYPFE